MHDPTSKPMIIQIESGGMRLVQHFDSGVPVTLGIETPGSGRKPTNIQIECGGMKLVQHLGPGESATPGAEMPDSGSKPTTIQIESGGTRIVMSVAPVTAERAQVEQEPGIAAPEIEQKVAEGPAEPQLAELPTEAMLRTVPEPVMVTDLQGYITFVNDALAALSGYNKDELIGVHHTELVPEQEREAAEAARAQALDSGEGYESSHTLLTLERQEIPVAGKVSVLRDQGGQTIGLVTAYRDIRETRSLISRLEQERMELEEKLRQLSAQQGELLSAEKRAAVDQMVSRIGHELRNPLGIINNSAYYLNMRLKESADDRIKRHLEIIQREVNIADRIISDLLDLSRVKETKLKKVDINSIITETLSRCNVPDNIIEMEIALGPHLPPVMGDDIQLGQVFVNLISNAVQAMPDGGKLTLRTHAEGDAVKIEVGDTGIGIGPEDLPRVFEPMFTTRAKGTGLGLAITREIIQQHGGTIEAKSRVEGGTIFTITLPAAPSEENSEIKP